PNKRDKPNKPNNDLLLLADFFSILLYTDKLIRLLLHSDFSLRSMPRHHDRRVLQGVQPFSNGFFNGVEVSAPEIGSPDAAAKECVPGQDKVIGREMKTHRPGGVAWRIERDSRDLADQQLLFILEQVVGHGDRHVNNAEHPA